MKIEINEKILWTEHARRKIRYYSLSKKRVMRVFRSPDRKELGVAPLTTALMQRTGTKKNPTEIWLMYQKVVAKKKKLIKIISAWRYPGISPKGELPQIPEDTLLELEKIKKDGETSQ